MRPLESVGCYVPGGRAVYPSSVCMTVVPAVVAGVARDRAVHAAAGRRLVPSPVLYAARKAGAHFVAKTGGAQAIAAMAYGTESIPRVDRIVGPGNAYVTEAKRQVAGSVGIDGLAGPSELAIVADGDVDIDMAALDLIAQAEHDPEARTFFITPDPDLADRVAKALDKALDDAGRRTIVDAALAFTKAVLVRDLDQAAEVVNDLASEHLLLLLPTPDEFLPKVRNAGAIFLGPWSAVPFGDYGVASNHVLPTAGTARFSSGLRAADYVTVTSVVELDKDERGPLRTRRLGDRHRRGARRPREGDGRPRRGRRGRRPVSPAPEPRAGVRDVDPYVSPQLDVAVRLNTNECPAPVARWLRRRPRRRGAATSSLHRYPDGQMTRLREAIADHHGHAVDGTWAANGSNELLTELLLAYGGPGQRAVVFEPTYLLHSRLSWLTHTELDRRRLDPPFVLDAERDRRGARPTSRTSCSSARPTTRPATRSRWTPSRRSPAGRMPS